MDLNRELNDAIANGDVERIRLLVSKGASLKHRDEWGRTPLIYCAARKGLNRVEVLKTLIELGSDVNAKNHSGRTALMEAGDQDLIDILLANGADSETKNRNGKSRKAKKMKRIS